MNTEALGKHLVHCTRKPVCTVYSERGGDRVEMRLKSWEFQSTVYLTQSPHLQAYRITNLV